MSDLVQKLRAANTWLNEGDCCGQLDASGTCMAPACIFGEALKMAHEAAARIERLEKALREIMGMDEVAIVDFKKGDGWLHQQVARAALEGK